ncbi:unnamed protein product (macronuclear) [Paramecium tetraurelia]|uniref:Transmembrane protein n=1 Tax=Paramecium tetraurelia TaxID=5888 RepID=A0BP00_PARTE|nr:uncharacterized protein GSPATT00030906001 [Paramecium tetraurelia]CAK60267.1 unnamed protein product [Paramecium tetraurelia]|eukprot:XP_001427665.1 hypothetical protein (macronuclear) [Paramecium tetraurelia strain d4-2]
MINEEETNYFYIFQIGDQITRKKVLTDYPYSKNQERKLYIQSDYLYRVTKKNEYNNQNQVEMFQYDSQTLELTKFTTINSQFFVDNDFTLQYQDYQNIQILDFKCSDTNQLSFLDELQNIVQLQRDSNEWTLKVDKCKYKIHSYDIDFISNKYMGVGTTFLYYSYWDSKEEFSFDISKYTPYFNDYGTNLASSESLKKVLDEEITFSKQGDFSQVLIDKKLNELFSIQGNRVLRFKNNYMVDLVYHPTDEADLNVYQAWVKYKGCTLNIEYQTIASDSEQLIQVRKEEFMFYHPFFASTFFKSNRFNSPVLGPNISIAILDEKEMMSDNFYQQHSEKVKIDIELITNYVFLEMVDYTQNFYTKFIVISQDDKMKLTFQLCQQKEYNYYSCSKVLESQLDYKLTKESTCISSYKQQISISTLISSEQLQYIIYQDPNHFTTYSYTLDKEQEIDTIAYFTFTLVLSSSKQQVVYFYSLNVEMNFLYSFSSKDYEFIKPSKLFYQQQDIEKDVVHLLYLFNKQDQLLVILYLNFNLHYVVNQIQLKDVENISVFVGYYQFVVVQERKNTNHEISIYQFQDECNIIFEKSIPLYSFAIENIIENTLFSSYIKSVFVKSKDRLLMYLINNPSHNTFFNEIRIDKDVNDIFTIGRYLLFAQDQEVIMYDIYPQFSFNYKVNMNNDIFVQYNQTQVLFSNDKSKLNIKQMFKYLNMNTKIDVYPEKLKIVTKLDEAYQDNFVQDMGSDWYSGQVVLFHFLNNEVVENIQIIQPINETEHIFYYASRSIKHYDDTTFFILFEQNYSLVDKANGNLIKEFKFLDKDLKCKSILYGQDQNFIVSCSKGRQEIVFGISCKNQDCQNSKGLLVDNSLNKAFYIENNMFLVGQYNLFVFWVKESLLKIEAAQLIGEIKIDSDYYSNTIVKIKPNHYHFYQFNTFRTLKVKELKIQDDRLIIFNTFAINVEEYLNREYFMNKELVEIEVLSTSLEGELLQGKYLFFAQEGAHYGMNYNFTCNDLGCQVKDQEVFAVIQGYEGFWLFEKNTPTISLQNDLLLILYQSIVGNSKILAAYRLPQKYQKNVPIIFFGALEFFAQLYKIEKQLTSYKLNNKEYILFNNYDISILTRYEVNPSPKIVYNGIMKENFLCLSVQNHFSKELLYLDIDIKPSEKSYLWLWILLGVLGGLLCVGIGVYFYKNKKKVDTLI